MYYNTCPLCGANLDPGEKCDCEKIQQAKREEQLPSIKSCSTKQKSIKRHLTHIYYIKNPLKSQHL